MNPRLIAAGGVAVVLALLILLTRLPLSGPVPEPARQYEAIVDRLFIFKGWLTLAPSRAAAGEEADLSQIRIDWSRVEDGDRALAQEYYRDSYLPEDIRRFNHPYTSTDRSLFDVLAQKDGPDRLRQIAPASHEFRSPFYPTSRWTGKLYFADTPRPAASSAPASSAPASSGADSSPDSTLHPALILEPAGGAAPRIVLTPLESYEGNAGRELRVLAPSPSPQQTEVAGSLIRFTDAAHRPLASLWRVKNQVLLLMAGAPAGEQIEIRVNGHDLPNGPENRGDLHLLPADARLAFRDRTPPRLSRRKAPAYAQQVWLLQDPTGPDPIYDAHTEIWHNTTQNPLFPQLAQVLGAIAAQKGTDSDTPVTLTLSQALEAEAAKILQQRLIRASGTQQPQSVAAVTLMDAMSGNLLALPTAPVPPDVSGLPGLAYREDLQRENHNFTRLAVGSVAKVLLGAAILQADLTDQRQSSAGQRPYPGLLLTMSLPPSAADSCGTAAGLDPGDCLFNSVLGIPWKGPGIHDEQAGWIDLREAIARSINRYALTLLTLAAVRHTAAAPAADDARRIEAVSDQVKIGGVQLKERPANLVFEPGEHGNFLAEDLKWVGVARQLYRINTATREQSSLNATRDYIWDGLPCALRPAQHSPLLATLSPETENLRLDAIQLNGALHEDFRERYLPLILGDGESRWSNVELAEAFASLVQNRRVEAALVSSIQTCDRRPPPPWPSLDPQVQRALTDGMTAVITHPQGTAHRLEPVRRMLAQAACRMQPQRAFALFGKTGTPELAQLERAPEAKLIEQLSQARVLLPDPQDANPAARSILYRHADGRTEKVGPQLVRDLWSQVSQGRGEAADQLRSYFRPAARALVARHSGCGNPGERLLWRNVFRQIEAYNLSPASHSSVRIQGGQLVSDEQCFVKTRPGEHAFGKHFVFVAALYDQKPSAGASCTGEVPPIDVSHAAPVNAVAGVVAIQDAHLVSHHKQIHVQTAGDLLCGPVAERLGLPIDASACRATLDRAGD